jgi:hypothetical protein
MKIKLQKNEARKVLQILAKEKKQLKNNLKVTKESSFPSEEQREKVLLRQEAEVKEIEVIIEKFECEIFVNG